MVLVVVLPDGLGAGVVVLVLGGFGVQEAPPTGVIPNGSEESPHHDRVPRFLTAVRNDMGR
jgi:hypothetical protein